MTASHNRVTWRNGTCLLALCVLAACAGQHSSKTPAANGSAATAPAAAPLDASYDWHGLVLMPFGTLLKSSPMALHEVLLFQDESHTTSSELGKDCYSVDGKPPRLVDHDTQEFLLCFSHDRLDRIEASVLLKAGEGPAVLARACSLWLKNTAPPSGGNSCEGHDGDVAFGAHLGRDASADSATDRDRVCCRDRGRFPDAARCSVFGAFSDCGSRDVHRARTLDARPSHLHDRHQRVAVIGRGCRRNGHRAGAAGYCDLAALGR